MALDGMTPSWAWVLVLLGDCEQRTLHSLVFTFFDHYRGELDKLPFKGVLCFEITVLKISPSSGPLILTNNPVDGDDISTTQMRKL